MEIQFKFPQVHWDVTRFKIDGIVWKQFFLEAMTKAVAGFKIDGIVWKYLSGSKGWGGVRPALKQTESYGNRSYADGKDWT